MLSKDSVPQSNVNSLSSACHTTWKNALPTVGATGEHRCLENIKVFLTGIPSATTDLIALQDTAALEKVEHYAIPEFTEYAITMADVQLRTYLSPIMESALVAVSRSQQNVPFPFQAFLFKASNGHVIFINGKFSAQDEIGIAVNLAKGLVRDGGEVQYILAGGFNASFNGKAVKEIKIADINLLAFLPFPLTAGVLANSDKDIFTIAYGYKMPVKTSTIQDYVMSTKKPTSVVVYPGEIGNKAPKSNHLPILAVVPLQ